MSAARDELPETPGSRGGWLYAIVADEVLRVKIGWALDVWKRLRELQTGSPCLLQLHSAPYHDEVVLAEVTAHAELAHARVRERAEWFRMDDYTGRPVAGASRDRRAGQLALRPRHRLAGTPAALPGEMNQCLAIRAASLDG